MNNIISGRISQELGLLGDKIGTEKRSERGFLI